MIVKIYQTLQNDTSKIVNVIDEIDKKIRKDGETKKIKN